MKSMIFLISFNIALISFAWETARSWAYDRLNGKPKVEAPRYSYVNGELVIIAK